MYSGSGDGDVDVVQMEILAVLLVRVGEVERRRDPVSGTELIAFFHESHWVFKWTTHDDANDAI